MKSSKAFLTGCDEGHAWMLPWFFTNFKKNSQLPLIFADFGVSQETLDFVKDNVDDIIDLSKFKGRGWFLKPRAMLAAQSDMTCWIDTDCEILDNIDGIFDHVEPNMLSMVRDHPWTQRRGELWHNSGVVAFQGKPTILSQWFKRVEEDPQVGDQEVLHSMLNPITKISTIKDLPHRYNILRIDLIDNNIPKSPAIMHWTGSKGKDEIRSKMNA